MMRKSTLVLIVIATLASSSQVEAGGLLKRLFGKRHCQKVCTPCTDVCSADVCSAPACTNNAAAACSAVSASVDAGCGCGMAPDPVLSSELCFNGPGLPPGSPRSFCAAQYGLDVACCATRHAGDPESIKWCRYAAALRWNYCTGNFKCGLFYFPACNPLTGCEYDTEFCGCEEDDWPCQYKCYRCCVYGYCD